MTLRIFVCESCGRAVFPRRLLCPDCLSRDFREQPVDSGVLEAVADGRDVRVGAVRVAAGPLVIARVEGDAQPGADVALDEDGDVPVAR